MFKFTHHRLLLAFSLLTLITIASASYQPAMADSGWGSLFGPLIDNVLVPSIDKHIDSWQAKLDAKKAKQKQARTGGSTTSASDDVYGAGDAGSSSGASSEDIYGAGGTATDSGSSQAGAIDNSDVPPPVTNP